MTFEELTKIKNPLLNNLHSLMQKKKLPLFKQFLRHQKRQGKQTIFFQRSTPTIQIGFETDTPYIRDIANRIELQLDDETIGKCHQILKNKKKITKLNKQNKSIDQSLRERFQEGEYRLIEDKPYIVYDIETTYATDNLRDAKFLIAYIIESTPEGGGVFKHIPDIRAADLFQYLADFDGHIIGYNHVGFDNPVLGYNAGVSDEQIEILQEKSIDPFLFLYKRLGRRIGLNALSKALVNVGKTLESGKEAQKLYDAYHQDGDQKAMRELKKYCKNDVKMTLLVRLALIDQKKLRREGQEIIFEEQELINGSRSHLNSQEEEKVNTIKVAQSIF